MIECQSSELLLRPPEVPPRHAELIADFRAMLGMPPSASRTTPTAPPTQWFTPNGSLRWRSRGSLRWCQPNNRAPAPRAHHAAFSIMAKVSSGERRRVRRLLEKKPSESWRFYLSLREWPHGDAEELVASSSAAHKVIETGQYVFFPSKEYAALDGLYNLGSRDEESGDGSIFCLPIDIRCKGQTWQYIVSIVTYGARFCDPGDRENERKTEALLREIAQRLELELTLKTIKEA